MTPDTAGEEIAMGSLIPHVHDLFDPQLQLEAEDPCCPQQHANPDAKGIHGEIVGTIAAIERLAAQLHGPPGAIAEQRSDSAR
jgi:hypothetical protein